MYCKFFLLFVSLSVRTPERYRYHQRSTTYLSFNVTGNRYFTEFWRSYALIVAPLALLPIAFQNGGSEEMRCAYCVLLMAAYWMTEALPLPITSLMPMVLFPFLGLMDTNEVGINYLKSTNFMFLGGLVLALAVEHSGLHLRIALRIMMLIGTSPSKLLFGFMITTGWLSMWISNTATTAMMIPIVDAIAQVSGEGLEVEEDPEVQDDPEQNAPLAAPEGSESEPMVEFKVVDQGTKDRPVVLQEVGRRTSKFFMSETQKKERIERQRNRLLLAVAYSANIGGTGVITGSPPNLVVPQVMLNRFGDSTGLTFASWMAFCVPVMSVNLVLSWIWLSYLGWKEEKKHAIPGQESNTKAKENNIMKMMKDKYEALGPIRCHELSVLICFVTVICLWFFRKPMFMLGKFLIVLTKICKLLKTFFIAGWGDMFVFMTERGKKVTVGGATPAILMVLVVFALPTQYRFWPFQPLNKSPQSSPSLIDWNTIQTRLPWGVILLLGGGFAVSDACVKTGLSQWLVDQLLVMKTLDAWLICLIVCVLTVVMTQVLKSKAFESFPQFIHATFILFTGCLKYRYCKRPLAHFSRFILNHLSKSTVSHHAFCSYFILRLYVTRGHRSQRNCFWRINSYHWLHDESWTRHEYYHFGCNHYSHQYLCCPTL